MAIFESYPFDEGAGAYLTEERWGDFLTWMRTTGVLSVDTVLASDSDLAVNPASPTIGTQIQVEQGESFIEGFIYIQTEGAQVLGITLNEGPDPRIDLVVSRLDRSNNAIYNFVIEGEPDPSPVAPIPYQNDSFWDLPLASVYVDPSAIEILPEDITDLRVRSTQGDGGSSAVTLESVGSGQSIVAQGTGPNLEAKSIEGINNATVTSDADTVTVDVDFTDITLTNAGTGNTLINDGTAPSMALKSVTSGTGITITPSTTDLVIANSSPASSITLTNAGSGATLVNTSAAPGLKTKGVIGGSGIVVANSSTDITLSAATNSVCILRKAVDATYANSTTSALTWDTEEYDPSNMHTAVDPASIYVLSPGIYQVNVWLRTSSTASATDTIACSLYHFDSVLSTPLQVGESSVIPKSTNNLADLSFSTLVKATVGDYFYLLFANLSGVSITVYSTATFGTTYRFPRFSVIKISD